jgi:hypothetical protein
VVVTPENVAQVIQRLDEMGPPAILIAGHIRPVAGRKLKDAGHQFLDERGNAYIQQDDLLVRMMGNAAVVKYEIETNNATTPIMRGGRAFEPAGLKVLFALLCDPTIANAPIRAIAERAQVAHGTAGEVMLELEGKYLLKFAKKNGGRKLQEIPELLQEWAIAYARKLAPKLTGRRFTAKDKNWWRNLEPQNFDMQFGGEVAAAKLTNYLVPVGVTLYGNRMDPRLIVQNDLRPDQNGEIEQRTRFWKQTKAEAELGITPLPLIYADLLATHDPRCIDTAGRVRDLYLDRLKPQG